MRTLAILPSLLLTIAGAVATLCLVFLASIDFRTSLAGWLAAFALIGSLPLGGLFLVMLMRLVPGKWTQDLLALSRAGSFTLPLLVLFVLPVLFGAHALYGWADDTKLEGAKAVYLTGWMFSTRSIVLLLLGCILVFLLLSRPFAKPIAVVGMILFVVLYSLLATDWILSLDPDFYSSGFGLYFLCVQSMTALCIVILLRISAGRPQQTQILSSLLLTAVLLWGYFAFLQYLIIWSDNLPPTAAWYVKRSQGIWHGAEYAMSILRLLPGFLLLFGFVRRSPVWLGVLCLCVLVGSIIEMAWLVLPVAEDHLGRAAASYALAVAAMSFFMLSLLGAYPRFMARKEASLHERVPS